MERKKCLTCNRYLLAFKGHYLHPDLPCSGLKDMIFIEASIEDDFLHKKFKEIYGEPELDDYDRLSVLDKQLEDYRKIADEYENKLSNPIIKLILWMLKRLGGKK